VQKKFQFVSYYFTLFFHHTYNITIMEEKCKVACLDTLLQGADQEAGERVPVFGVAAADALKDDL
jgi:hypothetical protein